MNSAPREQAKKLAKYGRFGDKHLLHINDEELDFLKRAGKLHKNPMTGLPEAWNPMHGDFSLSDSYTNVRDSAEAGLGGAAVGGPVGSVAGQWFQGEHPNSPTSEGLETIGGAVIGAGAGQFLFGGPGAAPETPGVPADFGEGGGFPGETTTSGETVPFPGGGGEGMGFPGESTTGGMIPSAAGGAGWWPGTGILGSGITPMGAFLGLNAISSGYGLYQARQLEKQRKDQLKRQKEYQDKLNALMANPSALTSTPDYQFGLDQGTQALQRRMASMGYNKSGNLATAVQRYGSDYSQNALTQQEQILAQAYGMSGPSVQYMDPISLVGKSLANLGYGVARA